MAVYLFLGVVLVIAIARPAWIIRLVRPRVRAGESDHHPDEDERR